MPALARESDRSPHVPVLLAELLELLAPRDGGIYVDGTFGAGGYTRALLERAFCRVWAIDRDPAAIDAGRNMAEHYGGRLKLIEGRFSEMDALLGSCGVTTLDGVALDVGVSSMQIDDPDRGFSFQQDGPLDMRMGGQGTSAADLVNGLEEADLARLIYVFGEERRSRTIARAVVTARRERAITRTVQLAAIVERALGGRAPKDRIHPATRTFQALRIAVNDELGELARGLAASERLLKPEGRLAVVTFHSLEDRIVKRFFQHRTGSAPRGSRYLPDTGRAAPSFVALTRGAIRPSEEEIAINPRARSARLRAAMRSESSPVVLDEEALGLPRTGIGGLLC